MKRGNNAPRPWLQSFGRYAAFTTRDQRPQFSDLCSPIYKKANKIKKIRKKCQKQENLKLNIFSSCGQKYLTVTIVICIDIWLS